MATVISRWSDPNILADVPTSAPKSRWGSAVNEVRRSMNFADSQQSKFFDSRLKGRELPWVIDRDPAAARKAYSFPKLNYPELLRAPDQVIDWPSAAVHERLDHLREDADDEGEPFNEASSASLVQFLMDLRPTKRPAIFRLSNGNLRAVWEDKRADRQVGMQFLTDGTVQYVILRASKKGMLQSIGVEMPLAVRGVAELLGLSALWSHG
ncbi:hypothetical protein [Sphingomonas sp. MA1305]|uniref:hypothetical protein n=1 Tax=Sphingomonas sp. MA1305 TaxID=2479204 RepID=UPI0018DFA7BC|nr:hypothetical protein [Sphingomonas sp. MA1305]